MSVLEIQDISKSFGSLQANSHIHLSLGQGEVLALLGENGAGKTTLMNVLFGHYRPDAGAIYVAGERLPPGDTRAAINAGVGMVHQHFTLAENMTVLENVMLGTEPLWQWHTDKAAAREKLTRLGQNFGLSVEPERWVSELSVGERQRVEILKVLYRDARILIMDEPTAVLTPQESEQLFAALEAMVDEGLSIIFISHKLHEILRVSHRVAVMRRGEMVGEIPTEQADRAQLAHLMVGQKVERPTPQPVAPGEVVLQLSEVSAKGNSAQTSLKSLCLTVRERQMVGIAGVAGNGQSTLAAVLSGTQAVDEGDIKLNARVLNAPTPNEVIAAGIGRIPEDRHATGVVGELSLWENLCSEQLRQEKFWHSGWWIKRTAQVAYAERLIEQYDVRCHSIHQPARLLSGGNMQKLILARALDQNPCLILAVQPVRGLDEGAIATVQTRLLAARDAGAGVLLISEDLDELFALCDHIAVMYDGCLSEAMPVSSLTPVRVGAMMAGDFDAATLSVDKKAREVAA